ncbi:MAG: hypothetical protein D6694_15005 [Gammaproteobacteria bacterium]|nr:MAG: hypothetical protein D6694_15005 [Gammaproteobacteria bacterium]
MSLDGLKSTFKKCIKMHMNGEDAHGYTCANGIHMDCKPEDVRRLYDGVLIAEMSGQTTMDIRDYHNVVHTNIPVSEVRLMVKELGERIAARLRHKWMLHQKIDAATTTAEVESIVWDERTAPFSRFR